MKPRFAEFLFLLLVARLALAEYPTTRPFTPITYRHEQRRDPDLSVYVATVDLTDPTITVRAVPAGDDPDGDGEWQTTLAPVRSIAQRESFDLAINGSFFEIRRAATTAPSAPGTSTTQPPEYVAGIWAKCVGWMMTDGRLASPGRREGWPILWGDGGRRVRIGSPDAVPHGTRQVISGSDFIVRDGKPANTSGRLLAARHPRTAIGIDRDGTKLFILIVDGRRPGVSVGMTGAEMAAEFVKLGAHDAINLDGGGSTTLVMRDPETNELKVMNRPSDDRERPVADAIGVTVQRASTTKPN